MFLVGGAGLAALLVWGSTGLPDFGDYRRLYGQLLNRVAVPERHTTDVVTAINFDYRGFDTLGEEFILFAAVLGLALLLRESARRDRGRQIDDDAPRRRAPPTSAARAPRDPRARSRHGAARRSTSPRTATSLRAAASRAA